MNDQSSPILSDRATAYALDVCAGKIIAGPWVRKASARHLRDLQDGPTRGLQWSVEHAQRAITFIENLQLVDGEHAGQPFTLSPFEAFIAGSLFGWLGDDGFRRFRTSYTEIGKGNGKTPLAAAIGLYLLLADNEPGAEVYSSAVSRDQAAICFRDALRFVQESPALSRRLAIGLSNIAHSASHSFFRPLSSEGRSLDGKRVHGALVDELHEHQSSVVVDKMRAGTKGRRQALIFEITNSGYDRQSVCYQHHEYSTKILDGIIDNDSWFAYVASLDEGDDPLTDESCWIKANPNLGVSITEKYLREQVAEAREIPSKRNLVLRLNFCVWTEQAERWIDLDVWDLNATPVLEKKFRGRECYTGLDLSSTGDITALVHVFPPTAKDVLWHIVPRFFVPADNIKKRVERDRVPYDLWAQQGFIQLTPGNVVDYEWIRSAANNDAQQFIIKEIAHDRWNATHIVTQLADDGFVMVQFGQGFASMSAPSKEFEKLYLAKKIAHSGNPVLRWMASNVAITEDPAGNIKPAKDRSREKIDGIVAMIMGIGRAIAPHDDETPLENLKVMTI